LQRNGPVERLLDGLVHQHPRQCANPQVRQAFSALAQLPRRELHLLSRSRIQHDLVIDLAVIALAHDDNGRVD
jgi:hypothetical protein